MVHKISWRFNTINEIFPGMWSRLLKAHTPSCPFCLHYRGEMICSPWGTALAGSNNTLGLVWFPGIQQESLFFLWHLYKVKRACLLWACHIFTEIPQPTATLFHPSELPTASHPTALLVGSSSRPKPGWMTFRRPPPLRPASAVQQLASPK